MDGNTCCEAVQEKDLELKAYIGVKVLLAKPMNEKQWEVIQRRAVSDNPLTPYRDGYFVEYDNGYKAWSPKDVFETHYRLLTDTEKSVAKF